MLNLKNLFPLLLYICSSSVFSTPIIGPAQLEIVDGDGISVDLEINVTGDLYLDSEAIFSSSAILTINAAENLAITSEGFIPVLWTYGTLPIQSLTDDLLIEVTGDVLVSIVGNLNSAIINVTGNLYIGSYMDPDAVLSSFNADCCETGVNIVSGDITLISPNLINLIDVPEPTSLVLMSLGLFGLGFYRRKIPGHL